MENEQMEINYLEEKKKIEAYKSELIPFWKPVSGKTYKIKFLNELKKYVYTDQKTGEKEDRVKVDIQIGDEIFTWAMGIGKTPASSYGQIIELGVKNNGCIIGLEVSVVIKDKGGKNDYTIVE